MSTFLPNTSMSSTEMLDLALQAIRSTWDQLKTIPLDAFWPSYETIYHHVNYETSNLSTEHKYVMKSRDSRPIPHTLAVQLYNQMRECYIELDIQFGRLFGDKWSFLPYDPIPPKTVWPQRNTVAQIKYIDGFIMEGKTQRIKAERQINKTLLQITELDEYYRAEIEPGVSILSHFPDLIPCLVFMSHFKLISFCKQNHGSTPLTVVIDRSHLSCLNFKMAKELIPDILDRFPDVRFSLLELDTNHYKFRNFHAKLNMISDFDIKLQLAYMGLIEYFLRSDYSEVTFEFLNMNSFRYIWPIDPVKRAFEHKYYKSEQYLFNYRLLFYIIQRFYFRLFLKLNLTDNLNEPRDWPIYLESNKQKIELDFKYLEFLSTFKEDYKHLFAIQADNIIKNE